MYIMADDSELLQITYSVDHSVAQGADDSSETHGREVHSVTPERDIPTVTHSRYVTSVIGDAPSTSQSSAVTPSTSNAAVQTSADTGNSLRPPTPPRTSRLNVRRLRRRHRLRRPRQALSMRVLSRGDSYCDCPKQGRDLTCVCGEEDAVTEWVWDPHKKSSACDLSDDGKHAIFHLSYSSGTAAVRGSQKMTDGQYFWEIKMTSPVYGTDMMVGVGTNNVDLNAHSHAFTSLLGRDNESWGLSYYGRLQHKGDFQAIEGAKFNQGTIIGVHVDMWHGTLSFYKNREPQGIAYRGLSGKELYPMITSTAARTGMKVIKSLSFQTSLQFLSCQALRKLVPRDVDVLHVLNIPPGLRAFLENNLSWLLRPTEISAPARGVKRHHADISSTSGEDDESADSDSFCDEELRRSKIRRTRSYSYEEEHL